MLPLIPFIGAQDYTALDFLLGPTPAQDSLVAVRAAGVFLYNPSGAAGAAGDNGPEWGAWHPLCTNSLCSVSVGVVTEAGSIVVGGRDRNFRRSTNRGRTWTANDVVYNPDVLFESSLPALRGPAGAPALVATVSDNGNTARSLGDGASGTWQQAGNGMGYPQSLGEVPPSPSLPNGRLLMGVWNGITYSDDGALSWQRSSAYGSGLYIAWSYTFVPAEGHPYGGVAYAGVQNVPVGEGRGAELLKSDDGGRTWTLAHRFTGAEVSFPVPQGGDFSKVIVFATPDGALWAGVSLSGGWESPRRGTIARSTDGGVTWVRADAGFRDASNRGYAVDQFVLARDGRLYAATTRGAWRTVAPAVAGEATPVEAASLGVSVRPNPASGRVEVVLSLAEAGPVRVAVVDALGREVAVVLDGAAGAGETAAGVDVSAWPAGVYVVRAVAGAQTATARLVVAR
jgi:hypothetical protein